MNQAHRDLAKKRQEYLRKKAAAESLAVIAGGAIFVCSLSAAIMGFLIILTLCIMVSSRSFAAFGFTVVCSVILSVLVWLIFQAKQLYRVSSNYARMMPYVASVEEQIAALPPKEILVRGSDQPIAAPAELLRAAYAGKAAPEQELLRESTAPTYAPESDDG